jgi:hypothetical protein
MKAATGTGRSIERKYGQVNGLVMVYVLERLLPGGRGVLRDDLSGNRNVVDAHGWSWDSRDDTPEPR